MTEQRPTLLVMDDAAANIDILLEALSEDYTVRVATYGDAALVSVQKARPDLILLDIMMPGMDGFEVCRRLQDDPTARDIPIVFLTALNKDADEARPGAGGLRLHHRTLQPGHCQGPPPQPSGAAEKTPGSPD